MSAKRADRGKILKAVRQEAKKARKRTGRRNWCEQSRPMLSAGTVSYGVSERIRAVSCGGIGALHALAARLDLPRRINERLRLLKRHLPFFESDHVLTVAYNILCGGQCLQDVELLRSDVPLLVALGANRLPGASTLGDFCRRFGEDDVVALLEVFNEARRQVWAEQPASFFDEAVIDVDGSLLPTSGNCKSGVGMSYKGSLGYHPLIVSLANTQEPLFLVNRSGNANSSLGATAWLDRAIELCRASGFGSITLRGDTAFSQCAELDRWDADGIRFVFGLRLSAALVAEFQTLPRKRWSRLVRPAPYEISTELRKRPENVRERIVREKGYLNLRLESEEVAELEYQPSAADQPYRLVVVKKNISRERGEKVLFDEIRYFAYLTNDWQTTAEDIVFDANGRCHQESLIEQLKNDAQAVRAPVDNLVSNWAYMAMASLAWSFKVWFALMLPENGRWTEERRAEKETVLRMKFRTFLKAFIRVPAQIVRGAGRITYRLLSWNPYQRVFLRTVESLGLPLRC